MKLSAQEEYGLRCLLTLARGKRGRSLTIPEIAEAEDIAPHSVAKYLRNLRQAGIIDSERGQHGGYSLARDPATITVADALTALGGRLYDDGFCNHYTGMGDFCQHSSVDCSIRGLWMRVQDAVDEVLNHTSLRDLLENTSIDSHPMVKEELLQVSSNL